MDKPVPVKNEAVAKAAPTRDTANAAVPRTVDTQDDKIAPKKAPVATRSPHKKFNPSSE